MTSNKALLAWRGQPLVCAQVALFATAGCDPVVVVVGGAYAGSITAALQRQGCATVAVNPDPSRGMLSSLQVGLLAVLPAGAARSVGARDVAFTPVDLPLSDTAPIIAVLAGAGPYRCAAYRGQAGHPAVVSQSAIDALLCAPPGVSAREALRSVPRTLVETADAGVCGNLNTPDDVADWRRQVGA